MLHVTQTSLNLTVGKNNWRQTAECEKFIFDIKKLKINEFLKCTWQLIICTSNATLEIPSLCPWLTYLKNILNIKTAKNQFLNLD